MGCSNPGLLFIVKQVSAPVVGQRVLEGDSQDSQTSCSSWSPDYFTSPQIFQKYYLALHSAISKNTAVDGILESSSKWTYFKRIFRVQEMWNFYHFKKAFTLILLLLCVVCIITCVLFNHIIIIIIIFMVVFRVVSITLSL